MREIPAGIFIRVMGLTSMLREGYGWALLVFQSDLLLVVETSSVSLCIGCLC